MRGRQKEADFTLNFMAKKYWKEQKGRKNNLMWLLFIFEWTFSIVVSLVFESISGMIIGIFEINQCVLK